MEEDDWTFRPVFTSPDGKIVFEEESLLFPSPHLTLTHFFPLPVPVIILSLDHHQYPIPGLYLFAVLTSVLIPVSVACLLSYLLGHILAYPSPIALSHGTT